MKRTLGILALLLLSANLYAFDRDAFAKHLMKALNLDTRANVQVTSDPVPSGFGNLMKLTVLVGGGPYDVYMTKDEKQYFWGFVIDRKVDPDNARVTAINLKQAHSKGSATAPITVVEYSDLQCSHCKQAHDVLDDQLYKNYKPEQVRLVFKHFPLAGHDWAETAAAAVECASNQKESAFWSMQDFYFDNQNNVTKDNVKAKGSEKAKALGLNVSSFELCLSTGVAYARVQADKKEGTGIGVSSTPTLLINGRVRRGFRDFDDIKVVIDEKLKDAGGK